MNRRLEQLNATYRVLVDEWNRALRWRERSRLDDLGTAIKIVDALAHAEEFPQDDDREIIARLLEIVRQRNILGVLQPFEYEPLAPAEAAEVKQVLGEPMVQAALAAFPGAEVVKVVRRDELPQ